MSLKIKKSSKMNELILNYKGQISINDWINYNFTIPICTEGVVFDNPFAINQEAEKFKRTAKEHNAKLSDDQALISVMIFNLCSDSDCDRMFSLIRLICENGQIFHKDSEFDNNPYLQNIKLNHEKVGRYTLEKDKYLKYELFLYDKGIAIDNVIIPQFAAFDHGFSYPCIKEDGDTWMSITPNEILTMKKEIAEANGNVLTLGCGMGYFAYMAAEKENVKSVTIIEKSDEVIELFSKYILPQFENKEKIKIIKADAFDYMNSLEDGEFDYCFADIWIGSNDIDPYLRLRQICKKFHKMKVSYWIEESIIRVCLSFFIQIILLNNDKISFNDIGFEIPDSYKYLLQVINNYLDNNEIIINTPEELKEFFSYENLLKILDESE